MNLLILTEQDRIKNDTFLVSGKRQTHITRVLKAGVGDNIEAGLINGPVGRAIVKSIEKDGVTLECKWQNPDDRPNDNTPEIDIICALPRPQTFKKILQSCAAMGVSTLHFVNANRVEQCYFSASAASPETIQYYLEKGLSQGKNTRLPKVTINPRFRCFFEEILPRLQADQQGESLNLVADLENSCYLNHFRMEHFQRICVAIGPEGGWVPFEMQVLQKQGFTPFKLGDWPLRVENALVATLAQLSLMNSPAYRE